MFAIDLVFKNGYKLDGLIWTWKPKDGWFKALDEHNGKIKKYQISDVKEGKIYDDHFRKSAKSEDFFEKSSRDGFVGGESD